MMNLLAIAALCLFQSQGPCDQFSFANFPPPTIGPCLDGWWDVDCLYMCMWDYSSSMVEANRQHCLDVDYAQYRYDQIAGTTNAIYDACIAGGGTEAACLQRVNQRLEEALQELDRALKAAEGALEAAEADAKSDYLECVEDCCIHGPPPPPWPSPSPVPVAKVTVAQ